MATFGPGGRKLWNAVTKAHVLDEVQKVQLTEACRMKDRLDEFDRIIQGEGVLKLMRFRMNVEDMLEDPRATVEVKFDGVIDKANTTANTMKQLLASLRLPDEAGKRPQQRGGSRGSYGGQTPGGKDAVSAAARAVERWGS